MMVAALGALWLWPLTTPLLDRADSIGYLAPGLSLASDGDLLYYDEYRQLGMNARYFRPTAEGYVGNHWNAGAGLSLTPALAVAGAVDPAPGLGPTARAAIQVSALLWAALWAWLSVALIRRFVDEHVAVGWSWFVVACAYAGTPMAFYVHVQGARPHALEALLATALVAASLASWQRPTVRAHALAGALAGALAVVRTQAALLIVFPLAGVFWRLWSERQASDQRAVAGRELGRVAALLGPAVAFWLVQKAIGSFLYGPSGGGSLRDSLVNVDMDLFNSLVHPHHGLLSWSPLVGMAVIGLVLLCRRRPTWTLAIGSFAVLQLYLNATSYDQNVDAYHYTRHWAGGGSFGARRYLCCLPLFVLGLGELVRRARATRWFVPVVAAMAAASLWSLNLVA